LYDVPTDVTSAQFTVLSLMFTSRSHTCLLQTK